MLEASIIMRVRNEQRHLGETLPAVFAQRGRDFEVIVVDSGSTDGTLEIARRFPVRVLQIKPADFTYGRALNVGARAARGRVLVSLSGHAIPCNDVWLDRLVAAFDDASVAGAYSRLQARPTSFIYQRLLYSFCYGPVPWLLTPFSTFHNTSSAIRRDVWQFLPFDEGMPSGEDLLWSRQARAVGYRVVYAPESVVWHCHDDETLLRFVRRTWRLDVPGWRMIALKWLHGRGVDLRERREKSRSAPCGDVRRLR